MAEKKIEERMPRGKGGKIKYILGERRAEEDANKDGNKRLIIMEGE
jgi:hypothetical protein